MAIGQLPPWLDVRPEQFVRAASEGAQAGLAVARLNQAADEAAQRAGEHGKEFEEAQALRKWEQQQQMQMHAEQMQAAQKKSADELAARTMYQRSMMDARTASEKDRQTTQAETMRHNLATEGKVSGVKGQPVWHPADATTGAPGYFESATGTVHIPPKAPSNPDPRIKMIQNEISMHEKAAASGSDQIATGPSAGLTHSAMADALRNNLMALARQSSRGNIPPDPGSIPPPGPAVPPPTAAPVGPAMPTFPALPPTDKREKGQTYSIPGKAPHTWTGTGWVPYTAPSHDETPAAAPIPDPGPSTAMPDDEEDTSNAAD